MDIEKSYKLKFDHPGYNIFVIGAGGTGGYLIPNLAKIKALGIDNAKIVDFTLTVIDGDSVEVKNCKRQMFFDVDVGRNKAEVMSERYSEIYSTEIGYVDQFVENAKQLEAIVCGINNNFVPIIVGCVDNHKSRQIIHEFYKKSPVIFWLDSGNEETNGQVVCGVNYGNNIFVKRDRTLEKAEKAIALQHDRMITERRNFDLPCVIDMFPSILEDKETKFNSEMSCAERAEVSPQNIFVNTMAAQLLMLYLRKIITNDGLKSFCTTFLLTA